MIYKWYWKGPENPKRCMLESHLPLEPGLDKGRVENTQGCKGCGGVVEQISKAKWLNIPWPMNTMDFETSFSVCALSGQITSYVWTLILGLSCSYCEKKIFNTFQDFFLPLCDHCWTHKYPILRIGETPCRPMLEPWGPQPETLAERTVADGDNPINITIISTLLKTNINGQ